MQKCFTSFTLTVLLVLSLSALCHSADDTLPEIVVTATRLETPVDEVSGTILVVSSEEIQDMQARTVAEVIKDLPGIDLVSQGGPGKSSSVLLRGGNTRFTLVMIDGVEVNDPSNPERTFDFAHFPTRDIERIEILFGPQSTLYGSDAIGGVINIITRQGAGPAGFTVEVEGGSFETYRERAVFSGGGKNVSWSLSADHVESEGISAASKDDGNTERDGYENLSGAGNMEIDIGKSASLRIDARTIDAENELDYGGGAGGDDPNYRGDAKQSLLGARLILFPLEIWELKTGVSINIHERHDLNEPDPDRSFTMELDYKGTTRKAELVNNFYLSDSTTITIGLDSERETGESSFYSDEFGPYSSSVPEESARIDGIFVQDQYSAASGFTLTLGARSDDHSEFGREETWRAGISIPVSPKTRFRAVYGTGFRAPSIDQLFNPDYGNPDLEAEHSRGWDAGVEISLSRRVRVSAAWHQTKYDDLIAWFDADGDPNTWWDGSYENISIARTQGVDLSLEARLDSTSLGLNGSLLKTEDDEGEKLLRRPNVSWGTRIGYEISENTILTANAVYVGEREDWGDVTLPGYTLVNMAGSHRLSENLEFFGRVQNLLDKEYEEAGGYGTPGRSFFAGVKADL